MAWRGVAWGTTGMAEMRDVLVYVAGPISRGDLRGNIRRACEAGLALMRARIPVLVPHLTCYMGGPAPEVLPAGTTPADWYGMDAVLVGRCDALLRLPGESAGADLEADRMRRLGRPVFSRVEEVIAWANARG